MGGNPFQDQVDDVMVGRRVRVRTDEAVYEGWLQIREYNDRGALLLDAERGDGEHVGEVVVNGIVAMERCDPEATVERVAVELIEPSPYTQRSFDTANFREFVRLTRDRGALRSFPLVRPIDGGFEIVSGHRRTEAARRAGLDAIPVRVAEMTDWEATTIFLDEHVPTERAELNDSVMDHTPWYEPVQLDALVEQLQEDWPEDRLREHPALRWYLDNAYLGSGDDGDAETGAGEASDADEDSGDADGEADDTEGEATGAADADGSGGDRETDTAGTDDAVAAEGSAEEPDGDESEVASASDGTTDEPIKASPNDRQS